MCLGRPKKIGIHKERRFTTLGYDAGAVIHHKREFELTIKNTTRKNELVKACLTYLSTPELFDIMRALKELTERIVQPFLKMSQTRDHEQITEILPKLHVDLLNGKLDTLNEFYTGFDFELEAVTPTQEKLITIMAKSMADCLQTQRGREYGFGSRKQERATVLTQQTNLNGLPTTNLDCERDLAIMDHKYRRSGHCQRSETNAKGT